MSAPAEQDGAGRPDPGRPGGDPTLAERIRGGEALAVARGATLVERGGAAAEELLEEVCAHATGLAAQRIGVTGSPGAGKSTLTARLTAAWRERGERIGLVAVDPSSPFSGGAVLGDRVRLSRELTIDGEVFFRSLATRGALGGLAAAAAGVVDLIAAWGAARVLLETVGVGQSEVDIAAAADTTLLVLQPQTGDSVQALKAGVLEIADIVVVHKADLPGAAELAREVLGVLALRSHAAEVAAGHWGEVPVVLASSVGEPGIGEVLAAIERHQQWLDGTAEDGEGTRRDALRRRQLGERIRKLAAAMLAAPLGADGAPALLASLAAKVAAGKFGPGEAARRLIRGARGVE